MQRKTPAAFAVGVLWQSRGRSVAVVAADIDHAHARPAAGLDDPLLIAVAGAGVDVDAAEAEAVARTPAVAPVTMVEAAGRSGGRRQSRRAERSRSDQSERNLAKHFIILEFVVA